MILAIDTATRWIGIALLHEAQVVYTAGWISNQTQTVECAAAIEKALASQKITPEELTGVVVAIGPGSYTGLRIGLSIAKGLVLAHNTPLIPVPTFDILALSVPFDPRPAVFILEAGRKRIIAADYYWDQRMARWRSTTKPEIYTWEAFIEHQNDPTIIAGEISQEGRAMLAASSHLEALSPMHCLRQPAALATLGAELLAQGATANPAGLAPAYLRKPEGS